MTSILSEDQKSSILYWPIKAGIGIIPADTKNKRINYNGWPKTDFKNIDFMAELNNGSYDRGIAIRTGKTISGEHYLIAIDFDGSDSVHGWFGNWEQVLEVAQRTRIEWHGDKSRLHMFLLATKPVTNRRIRIKESLLEIKCENQALFVSPSIHKEGNPYAALDTGEIVIMDETQLLQLESKINSLSDGYMSDVDRQTYIRLLEDPKYYTKLGVGQGRHNGLVILGTSYYNRYNGEWKDYTDERRREKLWDWNAKLGVPLSQNEFDDVWKWIVEKHRRIRDKQHEQLREERRCKYENPKLNQLDENVRKELSNHVFEIINYSPLAFVIAHSNKKQILHGRIYYSNNENENQYDQIQSNNSKTITQANSIQLVRYDYIIINAIPIKIVKYEDPTSTETKYEVDFETALGSVIHIEPKTIKEILEELKLNGLVYKIRAAEEALPAILNAFQRDGKVVVKREVETPGFYLVNGKIVPNKIEDKPNPTKEQIITCTNVLSELSRKTKRLDIFGTFVTWGVVAPFGYVLKQLDEDGHEKWMHWIYSYGQTNTGKTTIGRLTLAIWGKHKNKKIHDIGFSSADNIARFGRAVSYNTFPVLINEVTLTEDKQKQITEALKHAVQSQTARGRLITRSTAEHISALSPCILTGNSSPPDDLAFKRRFIYAYFSFGDQHSKEVIKEFNKYLSENIGTLEVLGNFATNYILTHQNIFLGVTDWKAIGTTILTEFFESAGLEVPEWVGKFIQDSDPQEVYAEHEQVIRGFFVKKINEMYSRFFNTLAAEDRKMDKTLGLNKLEERLWFCCDKQLIPYIGNNKTGDKIYILPDIMGELKASKITCVTSLTDLAEMFQTKPEPTYMNQRTVRLISISKQKFLEFLLLQISE